MGIIYREPYQVPFYESDINHNMKLPQLLALALQISGQHSISLGMSNEVIFNRFGLVWIVTDYSIEIERLPRYAETVIIETEATAYNKLFCYRDFNIYDENEHKIMTIHSTFVLMDYETRKVHPVEEEIVKVYESEKIRKMIRGPRYHELENPQSTPYHVRFYDLDMNGHVNNSKYLEWMFDVLDFDFLSQHTPEKIDLKYVKEVHNGTDIESRLTQEDLTTYHEIASDGLINAQAIVTWKKK